MEITSRENPAFKNLLKLTQKKHRRAADLCIIEGEKIVREHTGVASAIYKRGENLSPKLFDEISDLATPQGILAIVPIPAPRPVTYPFLVLDGVQDPGNMGAILRSAAAFGFETIFCINCADVWSQKVLRAAVGTQFNLNIIETSHEDFGQKFLGELGDINLIIADLIGAQVTPAEIETIKKTRKFGLVLGNEGRGISPEIKKLPHKIITIPIKPAAESLNVAVAGGIIMNILYGRS